MQNETDEQMTETMIGEAITELLMEDADISWRTLVDKLSSAAALQETDPRRIRARRLAINEIYSEMASAPNGMNTKFPPAEQRFQLH